MSYVPNAKWHYGQERWLMGSRSKEFHKQGTRETQVQVVNEEGTMLVTNEHPGRHPLYRTRSLRWEKHREPFTVGRTGKISFRRVGQKVVPKGSRPSYGYDHKEQYKVLDWTGGDNDEPCIRGNHEIDHSFNERYTQIKVRV